MLRLINLLKPLDRCLYLATMSSSGHDSKGSGRHIESKQKGALAVRSLKGYLLIASPELESPFFSRTVILMLSHNEAGAMGIVLNRPTEVTVADIAGDAFQDTTNWQKLVYLGGPVQGPLMMVHTIDELAEQTVIPGVSTTMGVEALEVLVRRRPEPSRVVANYAGWGAGQLEGEFDWASWLTLPASLDYIFWDDPSVDLWETVVKAAQTSTLASFLKVRQVPSDPRLN